MSSDDEYRQRLYDLRGDEALSVEAFAAEALALGVEYLGVDDAHFNRLDEADRSHEVLVAGEGDVVSAGMTYDHDDSYCRLAMDQEVPLAIADASAEGYGDDPAYRTFGLACYLGATVTVEGAPYGTVCFLGDDPRPEPFTPAERSFVELIARSLGRRIERERHELRLDERDQQLAQSVRKYRSLVRAAPDAIILVDGETGEFLEANDAASDLFDAPTEELVGRPALEYFTPDTRAHLEDLFSWAGTGDDTVSGRSRLPDGTPIEVGTCDGDTVPVEISATRVEIDGEQYVQGILRDVSERRDREEELRLKGRAIEEAAVGVTIAELDHEAGDALLRYVNREFERMTGYDREEVLGRDCRLLQGDETDGDPVTAIGEAIGAEEPHTTELLNYRADGTPFWNELTVAPVEDETGDTTHYVGFQRDVSDRKRREHHVSVLNRVLRHNVRNRTNVVGGFAELLADAYDDADGNGDGDSTGTGTGDAATGSAAAADPDSDAAPSTGSGSGLAGDVDVDVVEVASRIADAATDLARLSDTAQAVETVVRDPGEPELTDVTPLVWETAAEFRAAHDVAVSVSAPESAAAIVTPHFQTALAELCDNAREHVPDSPIEIRVTRTAGGVAVTVADEGPGLPADERAVVEKGRDEPLEHGDGLGLWLVNRVVADAGGHVTVDESADGTEVTLHLTTPPAARARTDDA